MVNKIIKVYVIVTSIISILFVLLFAIVAQLFPKVIKWINFRFYGRDYYFSPIQVLLDKLCTFNGLLLFLVCIFLAWKRKWYAYLGLLAVSLIIYYIYFWATIN